MAKIVAVYNVRRHPFRLIDMSYIRWLKISEALARLGHDVDIATNEFPGIRWGRKNAPIIMNEHLRRVPISNVKWNEYDVIKSLFHGGFRALMKYGCKNHPFIISKLGSVVGAGDMDGIYFYGKKRDQLYQTQMQISNTSRYITLLSAPARKLWFSCFGATDNVLLVPGAAEKEIPAPADDPFPDNDQGRCLFAGNIYVRNVQHKANIVLVDKLNQLGKLLSGHNLRLYFLGSGDIHRLDKKYITCLGAVEYHKSWQYLYHADVGIVLAAGDFMHNNESTKIYHYLRAGLPTVSEAGFPNDHIIKEAQLGCVVENNKLELMAQKIVEAYSKNWDRENAINYILDNHTWDKRVDIYDEIIRNQLAER